MLKKTGLEKVQALEAKLLELDAETRKLAEERQAFEAEKAAFALQAK